MVTFRTRPRADCVCGAVLPAGPPGVIRDHAWGPVRFLKCGVCRSFIQSPQIEAESLAAWYDSPEYQGTATAAGAGYHNYFADEDNRILEARQRYQSDLLPLLPAAGRVLEIGCATGSQLVVLRQAGHAVEGVDLSAEFTRFARERHQLDVRCGDFLDAALPDEQYDLIIMLGTISNLSDPLAHLTRAHRLLRPGGALFANLPLADSIPARLYGRRFWMFTPSVSSFMSRAGVTGLLKRAGFASIDVRMDRQRPSLGKLAHHAAIPGTLAALRRLGLAESRLPVGLPMPGIAAVVARRIAEAGA